jgi:hypothetical protein
MIERRRVEDRPRAGERLLEWKRTDQAARRERFEAAHPGATLTRGRWTWTGVITIDGREEKVMRYELGDVLDALEALVKRQSTDLDG